MSYLSSRSFWLGTAERAIKPLAQTLIAALTVAQTAGNLGIDVLSVDWRTARSVSAGATLLSTLTSIASGPIGPSDSPSMTSPDPD